LDLARDAEASPEAASSAAAGFAAVESAETEGVDLAESAGSAENPHSVALM
jgi:hypothetical protein